MGSLVGFLLGLGVGAAIPFVVRTIWHRFGRQPASRPFPAGGADHDPERHARLADSVQRTTEDLEEKTRAHSRKLQQINDRLQRTNAAPSDVSDALTELVQANAQLRTDLALILARFQDEREQLQRLLTEARSDALTGLANRRAFDLELARLFAQRRRQGVGFSLMFLDLDYFKRINDRFGHPAGDAVLREAAALLSEKLREMDLVARYGGEEFAVLLPGTSLPHAVRAGERIRVCFSEHRFHVGGVATKITVSVGVATACEGDIAETLVSRTDAALYAAKASGRDRTYFHDGERYLPAEEATALWESSVNLPATAPMDDPAAAEDGSPSTDG